MIYSLFYRHNSFEFFLYIILGQQLLFKRKHRCVVPIHGHLYRKLKREVSRTEKRLKITITSMFPRRRRRSRARKEWICERRCQVSVSGVVYMYFRDFFALKPFRDYSLCSVCILPQPAFYSQSAVCILHSVCILPLVRSLQSAVRSLRFTLTGSCNTQI